MRIHHYLPDLRPDEGGSMRAALDLCAALAEAGHHVTVTTHTDPLGPEYADSGLHLVHLGPAALAGTLLTRAQRSDLARLLRSADILHLHGVWEPTIAQVAAASHGAQIPYIVSPHGTLDVWAMGQKTRKKRLHLRLAGQTMLERAGAIHTTAEEEARQLVRSVSVSTPIVAIPLITDVASAAPVGQELARLHMQETNGHRSTVLFLGRLHHKKRPDIALRALAELRNRGHDARLLVVGPGPPSMIESLEALRRELGVVADARLLGPMKGALKSSFFALADVVVLPTHHENFGLVAVEAMAAGTPIVTTRGTGIWAELESSGGAAIVPLDPAAFAGALEDILSLPDRGSAMGARGRQWVLQELSTPKLIPRYAELYGQAVNARSA